MQIKLNEFAKGNFEVKAIRPIFGYARPQKVYIKTFKDALKKLLSYFKKLAKMLQKVVRKEIRKNFASALSMALAKWIWYRKNFRENFPAKYLLPKGRSNL